MELLVELTLFIDSISYSYTRGLCIVSSPTTAHFIEGVDLLKFWAAPFLYATQLLNLL